MRFGLLPFAWFTIHAPHTPQKVRGILQSHSEARRFWRGWDDDHAYFEGECSAESFKFSRVIQYRNSFLPVITGRISSEGSGALVKVRMRLNLFATVFMIFWFGFLISASVASAPSLMEGLAKGDADALTILGLILFGYALVQGGFWFEASKAQDKLVELLGQALRAPQ